MLRKLEASLAGGKVFFEVSPFLSPTGHHFEHLSADQHARDQVCRLREPGDLLRRSQKLTTPPASMFLRFATLMVLALCTAVLASPVPQATQFNPSNAVPGIPGAPALDTAGWSLERGTTFSSASNPSSTADVDSGPASPTAQMLPTLSNVAPKVGPAIQSAPVATPRLVNPNALTANAAPTFASVNSISSLEPFTTLANDPSGTATAPPDYAGAGAGAGAGAQAPTPTLAGSPSSTLATLDPSAASAMADILSGLAALQDSTGLEEGATSKENPVSSSPKNVEGGLADPPAPKPASAASA